jgi:hypothetical protein
VGHAELAQDTPRLAAPVESMRALVESVAGALVSSSPASSAVGIHYSN